ncbi:hypothetical protein WMY93_030482 [Mugilogobius chulae]|uniref:FYVE, RhoGEF and PH domain containing 3 n=1 Tax=Mugilogobius chulae TaxID=88201 RepID=A0AAW0MI05_9GOBI
MSRKASPEAPPSALPSNQIATSQKPQVPPKPAHLLALGQDKKPKRIPPAPSRPLPAPPPPPKPKPTLIPPVPIAEPQKEVQKVGLLIEKFENSRVPILGVLPRSQLHLCLRMDTATEITSCGPDSIVKVSTDSSPSADPLNHLSDQNGDEIDTQLDNCSDVSVRCLDDQEVDNPDGTDQNGKIPNRDSGIDSPSCTAEGEEHYDSITETESVSCCVGESKRDSTQDEDSELDEGSSGEIQSLTESSGYLTETQKCSEAQKLLNIAKELLYTEEAYIKRLNLLDQVFCTKLTEAGIPQDVITGIFSNISSIYLFHHQFLLPELKTRITGEWDSKPRIGDILQKLAPFMKMYGEYVKNFDRAMDLVNTWTQRSSQFKSVVQNIQKQEVCGNLTLQHHMLEPVQRIPRYELLLKDYLKKLPQTLWTAKMLRVQENVKQNLPHTFAIIGKQRSLELQARTAEEKEDWIQAQTKQRNFNKAFNSSFSREDDHIPDSPGPWNTSMDSDGSFHERKSSKKKDKEKQTCKGCNESFNFTKRKHHCKFCGGAICAKCSKSLDNKTIRVCPECYEAASRQISLTAENCILCGQMQQQDKGKTWSKVWAAVTKAEPLVLFLQSNGQESKGARMIPLSGFDVSLVSPSSGDKSEVKHTLRLSHTQQTVLLSAPDAELQAKWAEVLSQAAGGETPPDTPPSNLTEHRNSQ